MKANSEPSPTPKNEENIPVDTPPKKNALVKVVLPLFVGLIIGLVIVIIGSVVYVKYFSSDLGLGDSDDGTEEEVADNEGSEENSDEDVAEEPTDDEEIIPESEEMEDTVPGFPTGDKRVAYIKDSDIWIVNNDGMDKYQITSDGDPSEATYRQVDWKSTNVLSYLKCKASCKIYTKVLPSGAETLAVTPPPFTQFIDTFSWSADSTMVAYFIRKADNSASLILNKSGAESTLKSYGPIPGRGIGEDDGESIEFSADGSKIVSFISFVEDEPYILVYRTSDGAILLTLADGRFPTFDGNTAIYYKDSPAQKIMHRVISAGSSTTALSLFNGFYLKTSPSRDFISYYSVPSNAELMYHDVAGSPDSITPAAYFGEWLSDSYLVAFKSFVYPETGYLGSNALLKVKRTDGTKTTLDTGEISDFSIED